MLLILTDDQKENRVETYRALKNIFKLSEICYPMSLMVTSLGTTVTSLKRHRFNDVEEVTKKTTSEIAAIQTSKFKQCFLMQLGI
ncbi:hypothetical protein CEXT_259811 [Caerostris extrusa]|uniref:Uncharacterized protein n=1 Tax=Caerostris extrusa TaxID=172846 RepID=A0AAV4NSZ8_CAEEX|nr:hypothetical protein CEXT_259811 [Caerostris extrusa]